MKSLSASKLWVAEFRNKLSVFRLSINITTNNVKILTEYNVWFFENEQILSKINFWWSQNLYGLSRSRKNETQRKPKIKQIKLRAKYLQPLESSGKIEKSSNLADMFTLLSHSLVPAQDNWTVDHLIRCNWQFDKMSSGVKEFLKPGRHIHAHAGNFWTL